MIRVILERVRVLLLAVLALAGCDRVFGLEHSPDAPLPPQRWGMVAGGELHTCGIRLDHTLWCWGRNDHGELGARATLVDWEVDDPRQVGTDTNWTTLSVGVATTCAIKDDQTLWCFGDNSSGQAGIGGVTGNEELVLPTQVADTWNAVSIGEGHACGIRTDGSLACWGANDASQLGDGTTTSHPAPITIAPNTSWIAIAVGGKSSCGLHADGTAWCWGSNIRGQVAKAPSPPVITPTSLGGTVWQAITVGGEFACGLQMDGKLRCWGRNQVGQLGDGSGTDRDHPVAVGQDLISDWTAVHAGTEHACGLHGDGTLECWGSNQHGELVTELDRGFQTAPSVVAGVWNSVGTAPHGTCAIDRDGRLSCAGYGPAGALGDGTGTHLTLVQQPGTWAHIGAGKDVTCGLQGTALSCWGENSQGAIGDGSRFDRPHPAPIAGSFTGFSIFDHVCAITGSGDLWCWGANNYAQLGLNTQSDQLTPIKIGTLAWTMTASSYHTCGIAQTVQLWCWGNNRSGEINRPPTMPQLQLVPWQANFTWAAVAVGGYHTCGIDPNHAIQCWGYGYDGQLGTGQMAPTDVMQLVAVPGNPMFDTVNAGERYTCAHTMTGNKVWCWGGNAFGQLGDLTTMSRILPEQLPDDWIAISTGQKHMCGLHPDHSLWCWGRNQYGQLGDGTLIERHVPTRVGTDSDWAEVSAGDEHTCARKQNGDAWCWGGNLAGSLGDGTAWRGTFVEITK